MQRMSVEIIEDWNKKHNREHSGKTTFPHFIEEVGELAREINHHIDNWKEEPNHDNLSEEMVDVLDQLFILANDFDVDLEDAFIKKVKKVRKRFELE